MARKTKGGAGRRPGQQRPRAAAPARRAATTTPPTDVSIEERLAELERERERLLAAAQASATAPAEAEVAGAVDAEDPVEEEAVEAEPVAAAAVRTRVEPRQSAAGARRVGRVAAVPRPVVPKAPPKGVARAVDSLDPEDPSIPLERVPYVRADLRRVGVMAGLMIVLIVVADVVVRAVVK